MVIKTNQAIIDRMIKAGKNVGRFKPEGVRPEVMLRDSDATGLDSLGQVEFLTSVEDEFDIMIEDQEFEDLNTVGDLINLIERKVKKC